MKKSVTLDEDVVEGIAAEVGERGFSGWLNDAARARLDREHVLRFLAELDAEHGPVPPEMLEEARRVWAGRISADTGPVTDLLAALDASARDARPAKATAPGVRRRRAAG